MAAAASASASTAPPVRKGWLDKAPPPRALKRWRTRFFQLHSKARPDDLSLI